ncbi:MAG TPA: GNAT family N-acetyltransferase, partial [Bdellovibrionales bacterium]|nr:GNAT family N-acetyltransferase [Bdellovibrionales bacterium]
MDRIILRAATLEDLQTLRDWDNQEHVIASDPHDEWNWETELGRTPAWREQLIAEADARPIGFIQIIDPAEEESHYWGRVPANLRAIDIWIGPKDALGKGYGTEMMKQAIARCFAKPEVTGILIDPLANNERALRFYERLGFELVERRRFGADDCMVYKLTREKWARETSGLSGIGVIEGFFGPHWPGESRHRFCENLRGYGGQYYIYAPKQDPYLRKRWMEPHPGEYWRELARLRA